MREEILYPRFLQPRIVEALADSPAGRMEILRLHPLSQAELAQNRVGSFPASLLRTSMPGTISSAVHHQRI